MGNLSPSAKQRSQSGERLMDKSDIETLTLAGAAAAIRQKLFSPLTESAKPKVERTLAEARGCLSSSEATASWMRGWTMEPEEAVRFALES